MVKHCLVDSHAHLDSVDEKDIETILFNARKNNVLEIISCSTSFHSNIKNLELAQRFDNIKCAIGLYPLDAIELNEDELNQAFTYFKEHINEAVAIGEVGLDKKYCKNEEEFEKQIEIFKRFIKLSKKYDKPLIIHSRYATSEVLKILAQQNAKKVLLHSFTDSTKLMKQAISNNWFVGVGLNVLTDMLVQKRVKEIPLEGILLETDAPIKFNNKIAMPDKIKEIAIKIAELKEISIQEVEEQLLNNYQTLFTT
ncbi:MAG: TatD family hydrolase [archaeon]